MMGGNGKFSELDDDRLGARHAETPTAIVTSYPHLTGWKAAQDVIKGAPGLEHPSAHRRRANWHRPAS
jgi:hypothetical protein